VRARTGSVWLRIGTGGAHVEFIKLDFIKLDFIKLDFIKFWEILD
jgi:hypothetical protein